MWRLSELQGRRDLVIDPRCRQCRSRDPRLPIRGHVRAACGHPECRAPSRRPYRRRLRICTSWTKPRPDAPARVTIIAKGLDLLAAERPRHPSSLVCGSYGVLGQLAQDEEARLWAVVASTMFVVGAYVSIWRAEEAGERPIRGAPNTERGPQPIVWKAPGCRGPVQRRGMTGRNTTRGDL
jgi:hypothetical protein